MSVTRTVNGTKYHVTTNRVPRELRSWYDLSEVERDDFDYISGDDRYSCRLFEYRGSWYDSYEIERAGHDVLALGFDGAQAQSYFDAIAVAYHDREGYEYENEIVVGHIHW